MSENYAPAGKSEAKPLNPTPPKPPPPTMEQMVQALWADREAMVNRYNEAYSRLWKEWEVVKDQIQSVLHKLEAMTQHEPSTGETEVPHTNGTATNGIT